MSSVTYRFSELHASCAAVIAIAFLGAGACGDDTLGHPAVASADGGIDATVADAPACPGSCDDLNDCTLDSCDPVSFQCLHALASAGAGCNAHDLCTTDDKCDGTGLCLSGPRKPCTALDQCHVAGACQQATGECSNPNAPNGKACTDGLLCTTGDQCVSGECKGTAIVCASGDSCNPVTGSCPSGFPNSISAEVFQYASGPGGGNGLVRAPDGQIFVAGSYYNTTNLGSGPITTDLPLTIDNSDLFIAQIDPATEKALWTQPVPGLRRQSVTAFAASGAGQVGLVGPFEGSLTVNGVELDALYAGDQYILGASATNGAPLWARRVNLQTKTSTQLMALHGIAGDSISRAFVVCGTANKDATDVSPTLKGAWRGGIDVVLASLDSATGDTLWAAQVGGTNDEDCAAVATDAGSNIYVTGTYRFGSVVNFGTPQALPMVVDTPSVRMYVAKLDSAGSAIWAVPMGEDKQVVSPTAMLALGEDVIIAGTVSAGKLSLSGVDLAGSQTFLARLDGGTGKVLWAEGVGAGGGLTVTVMAEGASGSVLLTGNYFLATSLGVTPLPGPNILGGMFVAQMDGDGTIRVARGYGDPSFGSSAVGVIGRTDGTGAEAGSSLLLGSFGAGMNLGPQVGSLSTSLNAKGATSLFLAKLAP